jgi:NADH-quinone oxidoreductase subunit E
MSEQLNESEAKKVSKIALSPEVMSKIDEWRAKFKPEQQRSAVLQALMIVQDDNNGHLTTELMDLVADYLSLPKIAVYEVATFYTMYELKPVGKYKIGVCDSISCRLCGSHALMEDLKRRLGIEIGETTEDGRFTLQKVECLAACGRAPVMLINKEYHEHLTPEKVQTILDSLE